MAKSQARRIQQTHQKKRSPVPKKMPRKKFAWRNITISRYLLHHVRACIDSWQQLRAFPLASCMTLFVIAIALALPAGLVVLLKNGEQLTQTWHQHSRISLFLKVDVSAVAAQSLAKNLRGQHNIQTVTYISPQEGLKQFQQVAGFGDVLNQLPSNPLPGVLNVVPIKSQQSVAAMQTLLNQLQNLPQVDVAKMDQQWLARLAAGINFAEWLVFGLALFLTLAVFFIIANTLRLVMENHRGDIEVLKLLGATNAYIRRSFLYLGAMYGIAGTLLAWIIVSFSLWRLQIAVDQLAALYQSNFSLAGLNGLNFLFLLVIGVGLGLLASVLATSRELKRIQPDLRL